LITYSFLKKWRNFATKKEGKKTTLNATNWVTHLWLTNQNTIIFNLKNFTGYLESCIYIYIYILSGTFRSRNPNFRLLQSFKACMYVVAGQAILRLPVVEMLSNYGYNVGWWLP
jgi:hypothetical protein